jgi:uncharacterized membrane protein YfcA
LVAGFVDSVAGGGGLITLPILLNAGLDPHMALGTNKLQATFGSGGATVHHLRAGSAKWAECRRGFLLTLVGAALGAGLIQLFDPSLLKRFIPVMLLGVAAYVLFRPQFGERDAKPRMSWVRFDWLFCLGLGVYDGAFGPGTGTFFAMAYALMLGFNLTKATAHAKVMNFASNIASLGLFLSLGQVWLTAGLVMGAGQWLGARIGSHMVLRGGARFIRPIFLTMVVALAVKLLWNAYR